MSKSKLNFEFLSEATSVGLTSSKTEISKEISRQLSQYQYIETLQITNQSEFLTSQSKLKVLIHFAGINDSSYTETLNYTHNLVLLLEYCFKNNTNFIFVIPNKHTHLYHVSLNILTQYSKIHSINYKIAEISIDQNASENAENIIKTFVYHHRSSNQSKIPSVATTTSTTPITDIPKINFLRVLNNKSRAKLLIVCICIFLLLIALILLQTGVLLYTFSCSWSSFSEGELQKSAICDKTSAVISNILPLELDLTFGSRHLLSAIGIAPDQMIATSKASELTLENLRQALFSLRTELGSKSDPGSAKANQPLLKDRLQLSQDSLYSYQNQLANWYSSSPQPLKLINKLAEIANSTNQTLLKLSSSIPDIEQIFPQNKQQVIGLLIGDSNFVNSIGGRTKVLILMTVDNRRVKSIQVIDADNLDIQLRGKVEPDPEYSFVTTKDSWGLADSAWEPNLSIVGHRLAWLIEKETSIKPDLLIVLNSSQLPSIIDIYSPIIISEYPNSITSKNLSNLLNNTNSSSRIPNLLYHLVSALSSNIQQSTSQQLDRLIINVIHQLESRQAFIIPISTTGINIANSGWSGEVSTPACRSQNLCISDFAYLLNTNTGPISGIYGIQKKWQIESSLDANSLNTIHTLEFKRTSIHDPQDKQAYKSYLRFVFPQEVVVDSVLLGKQALSNDLIYRSKTADLVTYGFNLVVKPGENLSIVVKTHRPVIPNQVLHYQLDIPNQPGDSPYQLNYAISYPKNWFSLVYGIITSDKGTVASPGVVRYNTATTRPVTIDIDFSLNSLSAP